MNVSGPSASQNIPSLYQLQRRGPEEAGEAASGPAEEAGEGVSIAKSAETARGLGGRLDILA